MKACRLRALESFRGTLRRGVSNNGLSLSVSADESSHRQPAFRRHMYLSCFAPRAAALACINIRLRQSDGLCIRACNCLPDTCQPADVQHPHLHLACQPLLHPFITLSGLSRHCLPPLLSFPCFLSSLLSPPPSPPTLDGSLSREAICDVATNILTGDKRRQTERGEREERESFRIRTDQ